ncbi:MAG: DNA/RNA helicase domain-containing protein, partial [Lentilactobacillus parabuchneri]
TALKDSTRYIGNSLNVLLRRGIKGMYLHAHDPKLESYLEQMMPK